MGVKQHCPFSPEDYEFILPKQLVDVVTSSYGMDFLKRDKRWLIIPTHFWPPILIDTYRRYWDVTSKGGDVLNLDNLCPDEDVPHLVSFVAQESFCVEVHSVHTHGCE